MGVFLRPDSKYYWIYLSRKGAKGIKERTNVLAVPEHRPLAERIYKDRAKKLAETEHFAPQRFNQTRKDKDGWTYIYFVTDGELIKIGRAVNVLARLRAMQTSHHKPLTVLATFVAHVSIEGIIQDQFRAARVSREWFERDPALLAFIARVKTGGDVISELAFHSRRVRARQRT